MKLRQFIYALTGVAAMACLSGCEDEKDLIIIEGNLPIKTSALYMVGDATPNGWSIDAPTPFVAGEEDPLVFSWEGNLNRGEMKLCLTTGSWDAAFIRPMNSGDEIGKDEIKDAPFKMHAGDPDDKWRIVEPGVYNIVFDLRNWTMSTTYLRGQDAPEIEPIQAETVYIVGDATPNGWNIDAPTGLSKTGDYIFEYEGVLTVGDFKACLSTGSWDVSFIRPAEDGCAINKDGVASEDFVYTAGPDNKWHVGEAGVYHLVFDLEHYKINATFKEGLSNEKNPIETSTLFMIGDATPGGWSMDDASAFTASADNKYIFTWEGELVEGHFKACLEKDGTFSCPFIRPSAADVEIRLSGAAAPDFVYTTGPDDQWKVTEAGHYVITFDLENLTITVGANAGGDDTKKPLESATLFMIGDATPNGWSMDNATELTQDSSNKYIFTWKGNLSEGHLKMCLERDGTFSCPFVRPSSADCAISPEGVAASDFVYTTEPDDQWVVTKAGEYEITVDLEHWTIAAKGTVSEGRKPLDTQTLYMIGDATPNGWSMDNATEFTQDSSNKYIFTWEGNLNTGDMKACVQPDGTFSCPFLRPSSGSVTISKNGVSAPDFIYTTDPDDKWHVNDAGRYRITFDVQNWTIKAEYLQ